ncbi:MAG: haloalkane dehalogenase [Pseudomonadota bacterium]
MTHHRLKSLAMAGLTAFGLCLSVSSPAVAEQTPTENGKPISPAFPYEKKSVRVNGSLISYVDEGDGPVLLFVHGNPTSSYLWRNIIPYVTDDHRVIALDLIGMGDSDKPEIDYRFEDHAAYFDGFIEALDLKNITLVIHDWGSALGMRYARLTEENVRALVFMEAIIPPGIPSDNYDAMGEFTGTMFRALRTPGFGEELVLRHNFFVESVLGTFGSGRRLSEAELAHYRRPFATPASRLPTLQWPREIPIGGEPSSVEAIVEANGAWLYETELPKLFFHAQPGALLPPPAADYVIANAKNITAVDLGAGSHYLQESSPHAIGAALSVWLDTLP